MTDQSRGKLELRPQCNEVVKAAIHKRSRKSLIKTTESNYPQYALGPGIVYGTQDRGKRIKSNRGDRWIALLTKRKSWFTEGREVGSALDILSL